MTGRGLVALPLLAVAAAGCTLGPDYHRPPVITPEGWRSEPATADTLANVAWWELFPDPTLGDLIRIALAENIDLQIAVERIEEARARYGIARSQFYPDVNALAGAGRARASENGLDAPPAGADPEASVYDVRADLFWEIDFFGRIRRATEAQRALLLATEEARRAVTLTLVADVARAYVELRDFDRSLEVSRRTLESRRDYVELARLRFEGGLTSELDWRQAEAEMHRVTAVVLDLERLVAQKENELSILVGRNPGSIPRGLPIDAQPTPPEVPAGLPSDLLERRPDVGAAEETLIASNARIGEAKALLFPQISLTGFFGFQSTDLGDLLDSPSRSWSVAGSLLQPIFNAGRNRRRVQVAESQQRQTLYAYERSLMLAFQEVEDSLVGYRKIGEQRLSLAARVVAERKVLDLSEVRYRGGVSDYLQVLDAQRSLFAAELQEVQTIREHLLSLIRLYRALGGGWPAAPGQAAAGAPG